MQKNTAGHVGGYDRPATVFCVSMVAPKIEPAPQKTVPLNIKGSEAMEKKANKEQLPPGKVVHIHQQQPPAAVYLEGPHLVIGLATLPENAQQDLKARLAETAQAENVSVNDLTLGLVQVGLQRYAHAARV